MEQSPCKRIGNKIYFTLQVKQIDVKLLVLPSGVKCPQRHAPLEIPYRILERACNFSCVMIAIISHRSYGFVWFHAGCCLLHGHPEHLLWLECDGMQPLEEHKLALVPEDFHCSLTGLSAVVWESLAMGEVKSQQTRKKKTLPQGVRICGSSDVCGFNSWHPQPT